MDYLADTVAVVRHLSQHPALGSQAAQILREADRGQHRIFISAITLMEMLYLAEAKRTPIQLGELIDRISGSINYHIVPVDAEIVLAAAEVDDVPELHDRMIVGTAKWLGTPILTGDSVIRNSRHIQTLW